MSTISTTTSSNRGSLSPTDGSVYLETDTNRLLVYYNGSYNVYNRDSFSTSTGGSEELHYPQGIFSSTTATYSLTTSPVLHLDASYPNGIENEFTYTLDDYSQTPTAYVKYWADRTQSRHVFKESQASIDAFFDFDKSDSLSNGACNAPCIFGNMFKQIGTDTNSNTNLSTNYPHGTVFYVGAPGVAGYIRPFVHNGSGGNWLRGLSGVELFRVGNGNGSLYLAPDYSYPGNSNLGPYLGIARFDSTNSLNQDPNETLKMWLPTKDPFAHPNGIDVVSNSTPCKTGTADGAWEYKYGTEDAFLFGFAGGTNQDYWWEAIVFPTALSITDINTVKDYLQNKYAGLHEQYLPVTGPTAALAE
tara:strand:+ start:7910 stop:8989 length:1080 start_codon:yes stop_codon:yes gene_type:complete